MSRMLSAFIAAGGVVLVVVGLIARAATGDSFKRADVPAVLLVGGIIGLMYALRRLITGQQAQSPQRPRGALQYLLLLLMVVAIITGLRYLTQTDVSAGLRALIAVFYLGLPILNIVDFITGKLRSRRHQDASSR